MQAELQQLQSGAISFDRFVILTLPQWTRIAAGLYRRYTLPLHLSIEDIRQELLIGMFLKMSEYDPRRCASFEKYCVFQARDHTLKLMNKWRNAKRRRTTSPSRLDYSLDDIEGWDDFMTSDTSVPLQERIIEVKQHIAQQRQRLGFKDREILDRVVEANGSQTEVADSLYNNPMTRLKFRLGNREEADRRIRRMVNNAIQANERIANV